MVSAISSKVKYNFFNCSLVKSEEKIFSEKKIENIARKESITEEKTEIKKIHIVKSGDTISVSYTHLTLPTIRSV